MLDKEILKTIAGSSVTVTGGTGLIGREIVGLLCDAGANVKCVSLDKINVHPKAEHVFGDLRDFNFCKDITSGVDYVCHVAGIKGSIEVTKSRPATFFVPLIMMNTNILEASRENCVKRLVYTSSIGAYSSNEIFVEDDADPHDAPMDMYPGWAKRMAELQIKAYYQEYGMDNYAIVRPCNVYGPGDNFDPKNAMVIPSLMYRIAMNDGPVNVWGDGSAIRDFAYSSDVAEGVILALLKGTRGTYVNLGSGLGVSVKELVETLQEFIEFEPYFDTTKPSGFPRRVMDIQRARDWLSYDPRTTLREGLEATWKWFVENKNEYLDRKNYFSIADTGN